MFLPLQEQQSVLDYGNVVYPEFSKCVYSDLDTINRLTTDFVFIQSSARDHRESRSWALKLTPTPSTRTSRFEIIPAQSTRYQIPLTRHTRALVYTVTNIQHGCS